METKVVHCKITKNPYVYIGRGSVWGNEWSHKQGTRAKYIVDTVEQAITEYEKWILTQKLLIKKLPELEGKELGCWCIFKGDEPCHGRVLVKLIKMKIWERDEYK